jgi:hypothetical protein
MSWLLDASGGYFRPDGVIAFPGCGAVFVFASDVDGCIEIERL